MLRMTHAQARHGARMLLCLLLLLGVALGGTLSAYAHDSPTIAAWRTATASAYGPGLYGNRTACGQILTTTTIGVAHRTMACGTQLKFQGKNGVVVYANVIDRGPYVSGRTFDLTEATVKRMGYRDAYDFGVRTVYWDYR